MNNKLTALGYEEIRDESRFDFHDETYSWYTKKYTFYLDIYVSWSPEHDYSVYLSLDEDGYAVIKHGVTLEWIKEFDTLMKK